ncbi:MAG: hypothetical protein D3917_20450 [Candidatus Electrothrix sp. AX5]|nr:hypothetical protein [Candidatus Electrothrix sp. AX5]
MSSFWPEGLSISDIQSPYSPYSILENAREEWETISDGVLTLVLQSSESEDSNAIITVHAKHIPTNRTAALFSIIHRLKEPYPVTIRPRNENIPNFLKKSYQLSRTSAGSAVTKVVAELEAINNPMSIKKTQELITNKWVSDTPSEFRKKLADAFNLSVIKSAVLNLTSSVSSESQSEDDDNAAQE